MEATSNSVLWESIVRRDFSAIDIIELLETGGCIGGGARRVVAVTGGTCIGRGRDWTFVGDEDALVVAVVGGRRDNKDLFGEPGSAANFEGEGL